MAPSEKQEDSAVNGNVGKEEEEEEERSLLLTEGITVLDFDMLCSSVAMHTNHGGKWCNKFDTNNNHHYENEDEEYGGGGVLRMWEGQLLDCFDHPLIFLQSTCCPCYRFGKNMRRAGFGSCLLQSIVYLILAVAALLNITAFLVTRRHCFLYLSIVFTVLVCAYLGFYRMQLRKKFNIKDSNIYLDDCVYHLICPCCTLSQESRTLEINNVQDGTWQGRGDTICVGSYGEVGKSSFELNPHPIMPTKFPEPCVM